METPGYMSPVQVRGLASDHRSDIFSFGVILHGLLSGKRAFRRETSMDTMQAVLREEAPKLPDSVPAGVRQIVVHCLEKQAPQRIQSAHDLRFALSASAQSGSHQSLPRVRSSRRRWAFPAEVAFGLLAGFAGGKLQMPDAASPKWSGVMLGGPEMALYPRLSPDGHLLAFEAIENGMAASTTSWTADCRHSSATIVKKDPFACINQFRFLISFSISFRNTSQHYELRSERSGDHVRFLWELRSSVGPKRCVLSPMRDATAGGQFGCSGSTGGVRHQACRQRALV